RNVLDDPGGYAEGALTRHTSQSGEPGQSQKWARLFHRRGQLLAKGEGCKRTGKAGATAGVRIMRQARA
ncbi:MAG: hypothetical protein FWD08_05965, partial [Alphaproteobacteria bacterium]|nr:hypothetical protein [Alphaproteobacteria bacterium]